MQKRTKICRILFQFIFFCPSLVTGQTRPVSQRKHRFPLKGHRLYIPFYVTCRNDIAFIFLWQWKSTTRGSQPWGYSLSFDRVGKTERAQKRVSLSPPPSHRRKNRLSRKNHSLSWKKLRNLTIFLISLC